MIRNTFKICLFANIMFCNVFAGGPEFHIDYEKYYKQNAIYLHKVWGFEYCLGYAEKIPFEKQWIGEKQNMSKFVSKEADNELKDFIDRYKKERNLLIICLDLYDSKEYQAEVKRIVKKYCKDCK
ncbi:hypothetical protein [Helicobacter bilis]|uniref:Uncharacterized protein n=2 Tax=Helicobacter bilis TaxID=37372 RepID=A0A6D2C7R4_9HELI|nr:hypothetical protein [Helicobacter bilis]EMZ36256.1 hypothetical protein C826_02410 [Helicobacter bilis WiWa]TLE02642.1 hypothetical protein LS77_009890 [Helicobacter bilis]TLE03727.1 hypothetical protein LS76_009920 [Helicobacter bilis]